jgi:hypothetical protein
MTALPFRPGKTAATHFAKAERRRFYAGITAPARRSRSDGGPIFVPIDRISARRDDQWHLRIEFLPDTRTLAQKRLGEPEPGRSALFLRQGAAR